MSDKDKGAESDRERFEKNLGALLVVPKAEVEELETKRVKRQRPKQEKSR
jgi:hypothetical protein